MHNEPDLDRLLDSALRAYTEQEPQLGMEARVLRKAQSPRPGRWVWAAIPVLAVLALAVLLPSIPRVRKVQGTKPLAPQLAVSVAAQSAPEVPKAPPRRMHRPVEQNGPTSQQLALFALVKDFGEQAPSLIRDLNTEIHIEPLDVVPLNVAELPAAPAPQ